MPALALLLLLCVEGACAIEEPPPADPERGACDGDGTAAPSGRRHDLPLTFFPVGLC